MKFDRIILLVLDSLGVGTLSDAKEFGDEGAHTLLHTLEKHSWLKLETLNDLGLLELIGKSNPEPNLFASYFCRMKERSQGKDTTTGHWEMMGIILENGFQTFPEGFPQDFMKTWSQKTGFGFLGNKPASGTVIIDELGAEHLATRKPIVYTSGDSVFQIACHEEIFGLQKLYDLCELTRAILNESAFKVGRVIARPFLGSPGNFKRTGNRHDYSAEPPSRLFLEDLQDRKIEVIGIGKIPDIFAGRGISNRLIAKNDEQVLAQVRETLESKEFSRGLLFANLNDLDMLYGHRRDSEGYAKQIQTIDRALPAILSRMNHRDLLMITADHGNDPTFKGTDHTREYVPLLMYSHSFSKAEKKLRHLPDRETFADLGKTILHNFGIESKAAGESLLSTLKNGLSA